MKQKSKFQLIVTDIDNTIFDWVSYYVNSFSALLDNVSKVIGVSYEQLAEESREVFTRHASIEYPFLIQELPSANKFYGDDIDRMLEEAVEPSRQLFKKVAETYLSPYAGVLQALKTIKERHPMLPIVALTDAPRYVAMWKLNKLGALHYFSAVYGLADPRLPTSPHLGRVKVNPKILLKHLQQHNFDFVGKIRILPDEYEKPGTRGLKTVLMDYELDEPAEKRQKVLWIGDNLRKDMGLGKKLGVRSVWAEYGASVNAGLLTRLKQFSPLDSVHKNASLPTGHPDLPTPDGILKDFGDVVSLL